MPRRAKQARLLNNREVVFSAWCVPRSYPEDNWHYRAVEGSRVDY
jgi:hypothetical protein